MSNESTEEEYLLVGFGSGSGLGSPGGGGETIEKAQQQGTEENKTEKKDEIKKVEVPKTNQTDEDNIITKADEKKEKDDAGTSRVKPLIKGKTKGSGIGSGEEGDGSGNGGFGFELDFGGTGMRKIYSYNLPAYPEGVSKEIDVKLRFTILPDGTVSKIFPVIKADARLEFVAINSLRQWRFEPLPPRAKQVEQTVVVTFPYRLQ